MASASSTAKRPKARHPKGSPVVIVLMIIVVLPSVLLADAWGAGAAGIIGGLTGMFSLVVFMGGPLKPDLRVIAVMGPLLIFAAVVPRLVAEVSRPAAIALVVVLIFVAALLPLIGPRFANASMGLGMTTVFGYGYAPAGGADHRQIVVAAIAGVAVAVLLRVLMGISDPSKPTREQIATVLIADDPGAATATAFGTWLSDGRQRWLADALDGASRYRLALHTAELSHPGIEVDTEIRDRAKTLADQLKAKPGTKSKNNTPVTTSTPTSAPADSPFAEATRGLDAVEQAMLHHDTSSVELDRDRRHQLRDAVLHPTARLRSIQVRHALRTALAILLMLLITSGLQRGDPLVSTVLLATFGIMQASWNDTATKARNKIIGLVAGSLAVAVILLLVPHPRRRRRPVPWPVVHRHASGSGQRVHGHCERWLQLRDPRPEPGVPPDPVRRPHRGGRVDRMGARLHGHTGVSAGAPATTDRDSDRRHRGCSPLQLSGLRSTWATGPRPVSGRNTHARLVGARPRASRRQAAR